MKEALVSAYKSNLATKLNAELKESSNGIANSTRAKQFGRWSTTWGQQFSVLLRRGLKERKHESFSGLKIGQVLVVALLVGFLWWQSSTSHLQDQV